VGVFLLGFFPTFAYCFMIVDKIQYLLILILLFFGQLLTGSEIDSLKRVLAKTHDAEKKTEIYYLLAAQYLRTDVSESHSMVVHALNLSRKTASDKYTGKIYGLLGDIAIARDSMDKARDYYELALKTYKQQENKLGIVIMVTILGNIAFEKDNLSKALQLYQRGILLAKENHFQKRLDRLYLNIGVLMTASGRHVESQEYFSKALDAFVRIGDSSEIARAYSNLGSSYLAIGDLETAKEYFDLALDLFRINNASISIAMVFLNLSQIEYEHGNYDNAMPLLFKAEKLIDENYSAYFEGPRNTLLTEVYLYLGRNYFQLNRIDSAYYYLNQSFRLALTNKQLTETSKSAELLSLLWQQKQNADSALYYHILYKAYSDSLSLQQNNKNLAYQEAQFKFEQQAEKEAEKRQIESDWQYRNIVILIVTIVFLALVLILLGLLLRLSRTKIKQGELEQKSLKSELELRNKELTTHLMYQVKNNEFILNISKNLKGMLSKAGPENKTLVNRLIKEIEMDSSTNQWEGFEIRFQQVHTDFYKNLGKAFPDLTSNELRLCAFLKLNMNTKDIAAITYQSTNSIAVARWRLRQKFGLEKEGSLATFLTQF
jgi:tetratricopeptide (TPR) repeat protein